MTATGKIFVTGLSTVAVGVTLFAAQAQMPRTTTEPIKGVPVVTTEQLHGTVVYVEGNDLVVRMSNGDVREFHVPPSRRFVVDGQELTVGELKPGTTLSATITTTTTPVTERTTTVGSGTVWWVSGNTVIVTLPNNENRTFKVTDSYRFTVSGQPASVHDLRRGMKISAQRIVEEPRTEIASATVVTGNAPVVAPHAVAEAPAPSPAPAPAPRRAAPAAVQVHAPPVAARSTETQVTASEPVRLPPTAGQLPLVGMVGLYLIGGSLCIRKLNRSPK